MRRFNFAHVDNSAGFSDSEMNACLVATGDQATCEATAACADTGDAKACAKAAGAGAAVAACEAAGVGALNTIGVCGSVGGAVIDGIASFVGGGTSCAGWFCSQDTPEAWAHWMTPPAIDQVNKAFNIWFASGDPALAPYLLPTMGPGSVIWADAHLDQNIPAGTLRRAWLSRWYQTYVEKNGVGYVPPGSISAPSCPAGQIDVSPALSAMLDCKDLSSPEGKIAKAAADAAIAKQNGSGSGSGSGSGGTLLLAGLAGAALLYAFRKSIFKKSTGHPRRLQTMFLGNVANQVGSNSGIYRALQEANAELGGIEVSLARALTLTGVFDAAALFDLVGPGFVGVGSKAVTTAGSVSPEKAAAPGTWKELSVQFVGDVANVAGQTVTFNVTNNGAPVAGATTGPLPTTAGAQGRNVAIVVPYVLGDVLDVEYVLSAPLTATITNIDIGTK